MPSYIMSAVRIGAAVYAGLCLVLLFGQSRQIYVPAKTVDLNPANLGMQFEEISFSTEDGENITGWFVPAKQGETAPTILFCHGNGGNISGRIESIATFHKLGCNVLIFDYRGYGASSGKPTEKGTYTDAYTAWKYLTSEKNIPSSRIIIFGRSLGGSIATWLAEKVNPMALVIESSFTSAPDMAAKMFPLLPARLLCRYKYNTISMIKNVKCPVLIAHSVEDEMIPFTHGRKLFEAANEPKRFIEMKGNHNYGGLDADQEYQAIFSKMISSLSK